MVAQPKPETLLPAAASDALQLASARRRRWLAGSLFAACVLLGVEHVRAETPKSIVDLQPFRTSQTLTAEPAGGAPTATLTNLNPAANTWFLLTLSRVARHYHIENAAPRQRVRLDETGPALLITDGSATYRCAPWEEQPSPLDAASAARLAYTPLCDGRLYLRNTVAGHRTRLEQMAEYLRDRLWCGDAVVGAVKDELYRDAFRQTGTVGPCATSEGIDGPNAPQRARLSPSAENVAAKVPTLGIKVEHATPDGMLLGRWYPAKDVSGIHVSVIQPDAIAPAILASAPQRVNRLDAVEAAALDYLVAFDLGQFDLGFALGTEHPRLGWSPRPPASMRDMTIPGPDGIASAGPLVRTGMLDPAQAARAVATFTGGFKREHGAFKYGPLSTVNHGSHYGFIEAGANFSTLQPGLATIYVLDDGSVHMTTWRAEDNPLLGRIVSARQNGVALIEPDMTGEPAPGAFVNKWGPGNWSGSASESLRTLRAGACLQETDSKRFLIYGYFSTATPSAMARVFQAYSCRYAMLLDMNALEHTYLALYVRDAAKVTIEHLVAGMEQVDQRVDGQTIPRFVGFPDNRDFFYLLRRERP